MCSFGVDVVQDLLQGQIDWSSLRSWPIGLFFVGSMSKVLSTMQSG